MHYNKYAIFIIRHIEIKPRKIAIRNLAFYFISILIPSDESIQTPVDYLHNRDDADSHCKPETTSNLGNEPEERHFIPHCIF